MTPNQTLVWPSDKAYISGCFQQQNTKYHHKNIFASTNHFNQIKMKFAVAILSAIAVATAAATPDLYQVKVTTQEGENLGYLAERYTNIHEPNGKYLMFAVAAPEGMTLQADANGHLREQNFGYLTSVYDGGRFNDHVVALAEDISDNLSFSPGASETGFWACEREIADGLYQTIIYYGQGSDPWNFDTCKNVTLTAEKASSLP